MSKVARKATAVAKKDWKMVLEVVYITNSDNTSGIKDMQKKLNQWKTAGTYIKHRVTPLSNGPMLFEIILYK